MIFNLFLVILWLLALVSPVGDYQKYIESLSDLRIIAPDKPAHVVLVSEMVLSVLPTAPAPLPRYSPLVVPLWTPVAPKKSRPTRFTLSKQMFAVFKWVDAFLAHLTGRPRPTITSRPPTKVFVFEFPAPPTPGSRVLDETPASTANSAFDLTGLWDAYKLILGWTFITLLVIVFTLVQFIARARANLTGHITISDDNTNTPDDSTSTPRGKFDPESLSSRDSTVDPYSSLDIPPVTHDDIASHPDSDNHGTLASEDVPLPVITGDELAELVDSCSSAPNDAASALSTWIDTKTGVEGPTETNGASGGGKTLEPAVSADSVGSIIRLGTGESSPITPSPGDSSTHSSTATPVLEPEPFPTGVRVHISQYQLLLESLITPVTAMERRRQFYGRVNNGGMDNPDLPGAAEHAASLQIPRLNLVPKGGDRVNFGC
ncbi:hypothetical protein FRC11_008198 [Ceratobasidium sp. 423]|nr:hypothetical protein FRC11_008198 [Ceratobasidium sp. 423]